mmetsp:Transcript_7187/g.15374  ORF Transcript_7187/g.15374 Transcript_7187/m.15374 type:complete len:342 (-) Transcript_7187:476-1501(-)
MKPLSHPQSTHRTHLKYSTCILERTEGSDWSAYFHPSYVEVHDWMDTFMLYSCVVVESGLLLGLDLHDALHKVFMHDFAAIRSQRQHSSLHAHRLEHCAVEILRGPRQLVVVHVLVHAHLPGMNLQNPRSRAFIRMWELDLPINPPTPQQRRVQNIHPIRRRNHLNPIITAKPIQLIQQLQHRPLHLAVSTQLRIKPLGAHRVQLINEDNRGRFLLCQLKRVPYQLRAVSNEHLHQLWPCQFQKRRVSLRSTCASKQCFPHTGRSVHQHAFRWLNADILEAFRMRHGQNNGFNQLLDLLIKPSNVTIVFRGLFINFHCFHARVILRRQRLEYQVRILVHAY